MSSWKRTYWAVWVANFVTAVGMMSFLPFFPGHLESLGFEDRGDVATWAGVLYGAAPLAAAVMGPIWGALGDRFGRKLMVLRAMGAIALFVGAMAFATGPWQLLALRLLQGVFSGFVAPSMTLVSISAPPGEQGRVSGSLHTAMIWGAVIGPVVGELIRVRLGLAAVYLAVSACALVAMALVGFLATEDSSLRQRREGSAPRPTVGGVLRAALGDIAELRANRGLRAAVVLVFWVQFGIGATNPQIELFVRDLPSRFGLAPSVAAPFSVLAIANLVALPFWGRWGDRRGHGRTLRLCSLACAGGLALHAWTPTYEALLVERLLLGLVAAGIGPLAFGLAAAESTTDRRGGAFGVVFSARAFAISGAAMIGGGLSAFVGIRGLFLLGAALLALQVVRGWIADGRRAAGAGGRG